MRNAVIACASAAFTVVVFLFATEKTRYSFRLSMAAGYTSTVLIALALIVIPTVVDRLRQLKPSGVPC